MRVTAGLVVAVLVAACSTADNAAVVATVPATAPGPTAAPPAPDPPTAPTAVADPPPLRCDGTPEVPGRVAEPLREVSGIVASRTRPGSFWVHNDSGDSARLFRIDRRAQVEAEVAVVGARAFDWEDIARPRRAPVGGRHR